jgi:hypothetical protein
MAETKIPQWEVPQKKKVFFKVKIGEKYTEYKAAYEGLQFWGKTVGTKDSVKALVRRMILAENGVTEGIQKAAIALANFMSSSASIISESRLVWGGIEAAYGIAERLKLAVGLYYDTDYDKGESSWRGEIEAVYRGNDGYIDDAVHKVVASVVFGESVDFMHLYRELLRAARHAINVCPY